MALILGGLYLVVRRVISPAVPLIFIGTVFVLPGCWGEDPVREILSGGLMLGAIFMATDYTTSRSIRRARWCSRAGLRSADGADPAVRLPARGRVLRCRDYEYSGPLIERATRPIPFGRNGGCAVNSKSYRNIRDILISSVSLAVIAGVVTAALAGTDALTKNTIAQRNEQAETEARLQVIEAESFEKQALTDAEGKKSSITPPGRERRRWVMCLP